MRIARFAASPFDLWWPGEGVSLWTLDTLVIDLLLEVVDKLAVFSVQGTQARPVSRRS